MSVTDEKGKDLTAKILINPNYLGTGNDRLFLRLQVKHCTPAFSQMGDCRGRDEKVKVTLPELVIPLDRAETLLTLPKIPKGEVVWVSASLQREGGIWYSREPSLVVNELKLKNRKN